MDPNKPDLSTTEGVQIALTKLGYDPGAIDGEDGPGTRAAVQKFQTEHQPEAGAVDGIVGPRTRIALEVALSMPVNTG
jgi:peptidoglycan hydrolase-like protein with peptidoglycan-binding domain